MNDRDAFDYLRLVISDYTAMLPASARMPTKTAAEHALNTLAEAKAKAQQVSEHADQGQ